MGQNFITADRDQVLLMPPALVDWLPDEHFVWSVLGAVEQMDLAAFFGAHRANGQGRAAYDPRSCPEPFALRVCDRSELVAAD
jgi:hypothetical protein